MNRIIFLLFLPILLLGGSLKTHVTFRGEPAVSLRTITQAFNAIGYKLDITALAIQKNGGEFRAISVGNRPFSGSGLEENLKEQGIVIEKASLEKEELVLVVDTQSSIWNVPVIREEEGVELKRVSTPQWFRVEEAKAIRIQPPYAGKWYPDIAVFDRTMHPISSFRANDDKNELQFELPAGAYYLKVSNVQGMKLLKEGMWIEAVDSAQ
jgi:hypothetical protein